MRNGVFCCSILLFDYMGAPFLFAAGGPLATKEVGMRAVVFDAFGEPEVLHLAEIPEPVVGPDSVLVRIEAAGVNPVDWKVRRGHLQGFFEHIFPVIPGWDLAGVVEQVGPAIDDVIVGDRVIGYARMDFISHGTYAERIAVPRRCLAPAPSSIDMFTAAALPLAGLTAYQVVIDALRVGPQDTVLVHAGAGGVGHLAVQLACGQGARVLATASEGNHAFLASMGAEPLSYGEHLPEAVRALAPDGVDAIADLIGGDALTVSPPLLRKTGRLASVVDASTVLAAGGKYVFVRPDTDELALLANLVDRGELRVEMASTLSWQSAAEAHRELETGHVRGKISLAVD